MKVWITCFIVLFGTAELLQWFQQLSLPLPVFVIGGVFLAIASNYSKLTPPPLPPEYKESNLTQKEILPQSSPQVMPPSSMPQPIQSISFEIRKPFQPGD